MRDHRVLGANTLAVEIRGARKAYRESFRRAATVALAGVDLRIPPGQIVGLVGPNGAGKSTLLLCIAGMLRLDEGEILVYGRPVETPTGGVGYAPERGAFEPTATIRETLLSLTASRGLAGASAEEAAANALDLVELSEYAERRVRSLSRGMGQRLALAQALLGDPPLVLLDETLAGVDPVVNRRICEVIASLPAGGTTVVLSSHDLAAVETLANTVAVMGDGRISGVLAAADFARPGSLRERFFELLGADSGAQLRKAVL